MSLMPWGSYGALSPYSESVFDPYTMSETFPRMTMPSMPSTIRRMERELGKLISSVTEDNKSFQVMVDVSHFRPEEIAVKTTDKCIIVHAKHEERTDRHGFVTREFSRRVTIPKGVNPETVTSTMSPEGILTILAPKMSLEGQKERVIPITMSSSAGSNQPIEVKHFHQ